MANPDNERGKILYGDRFKQPLIFEGMQIGKLYPTDIDAAFEYHNRLFIFFEVKMCGKEVPYGQRVALNNMCDAIAKTGKDAYWLLCYHDIEDTSQAVDLSKTRVASIYYQGKEHPIENPHNAKEIFTLMLNDAKTKELKGIKTMDGKMTLKEKLMKIQVELKAPKNLYNSFGKYHYRNAEGIQEALKPMEKLYGVFTSLSDKMVEVGGRIYVEATATITDIESAESISVTAYAREALEKKGMDESQITGATSSYARKYALNGLFLLDDTKDTDSEEYQSAGNQTVKKAVPAPKSEPDYRTLLRDYIKEHSLDAASIANWCHLNKESTDEDWKRAYKYACELVKSQS